MDGMRTILHPKMHYIAGFCI